MSKLEEGQINFWVILSFSKREGPKMAKSVISLWKHFDIYFESFQLNFKISMQAVLKLQRILLHGFVFQNQSTKMVKTQ